MHMTLRAGRRAYARRSHLWWQHIPGDRDVVLAPPFTAIEALSQAVSRQWVKLSQPQNVHWEQRRGLPPLKISAENASWSSACPTPIVGTQRTPQIHCEATSKIKTCGPANAGRPA